MATTICPTCKKPAAKGRYLCTICEEILTGRTRQKDTGNKSQDHSQNAKGASSSNAPSHCVFCRALLEKDDLFCGSCGEQKPKRQSSSSVTPPQDAPPMPKCGQCGAPLNSHCAFCPQCGRSTSTYTKDSQSWPNHPQSDNKNFFRTAIRVGIKTAKVIGAIALGGLSALFLIGYIYRLTVPSQTLHGTYSSSGGTLSLIFRSDGIYDFVSPTTEIARNFFRVNKDEVNMLAQFDQHDDEPALVTGTRKAILSGNHQTIYWQGMEFTKSSDSDVFPARMPPPKNGDPMNHDATIDPQSDPAQAFNQPNKWSPPVAPRETPYLIPGRVGPPTSSGGALPTNNDVMPSAQFYYPHDEKNAQDMIDSLHKNDGAPTLVP